MVIDSSAIIAVLHGEAEAHAFVIKLASAATCRISAANYVEAGLVLRRDATGAARQALETLLTDFRIVIEPVSANQAKLALAAYDRFGKGSGHSARASGLWGQSQFSRRAVLCYGRRFTLTRLFAL